MRSRLPLQANAIAAFALTLCTSVSVGCSTAQAQKPRKPGQSPPQWHDCRSANGDAANAIAAAHVLLEQAWLKGVDSFFSAYTMPGENRSPFDLSPREPNSGPRDGFVEARPPHCTYSPAAPKDGALRVRFVSPFYRFHEQGQGWSPPLRNGLMLEVLVTGTGGTWKAVAPPSEETILLPDQTPKRPEPKALPSTASWAEPIPGCGKRQRWNGTDCISRKR